MLTASNTQDSTAEHNRVLQTSLKHHQMSHRNNRIENIEMLKTSPDSSKEKRVRNIAHCTPYFKTNLILKILAETTLLRNMHECQTPAELTTVF